VVVGRNLRFVPPEGALVEVTIRTIQGRLLLRPSPAVNDIVAGVLGHTQRRYPTEVCAFAFLSNHAHLLLRVDHAKQLADFMGYFNSNLAREIVRLTGEPPSGRRWPVIPCCLPPASLLSPSRRQALGRYT
jgi:hypothetical protein